MVFDLFGFRLKVIRARAALLSLLLSFYSHVAILRRWLAPHGLSCRVTLQLLSVAILALQVIDLDLDRRHRLISPNRFFTQEEAWWGVVLRAYERGTRHTAGYLLVLCLVKGALVFPPLSGFLPARTLTVRV